MKTRGGSPFPVKCRTSRRWRRGVWVPGAWEDNCTVCPPSGDNNSQSIIINQRKKQERTEEAGTCTDNTEEMAEVRQERQSSTPSAEFISWIVASVVCSGILQCMGGSANQMVSHPEIMQNTCLCRQNKQVKTECLCMSLLIHYITAFKIGAGIKKQLHSYKALKDEKYFNSGVNNKI